MNSEKNEFMDHKKMVFDFGVFYFHPDYLCFSINESENFTAEMFDEMVTQKKKFYSDRLIGCLSLRENSFSMNPMLFLERVDNIVRNFSKLAILSRKQWSGVELDYFQQIIPTPVQFFKTKEAAEKWLLEDSAN